MHLTDLVATVLQVDPATVTDHTDRANQGAWTSMRHLQLVVAIEEAYGTSFTRREIRSLASVADIRRVLEDKGVSVAATTGDARG
ncbi:acyl carrier protein [Melissospora conviva]|uniref:acyl carrier protein n=1 Tax=Melissospora conviva TaxID=3388432 RepID=UPI003B77E924